MAGTKRQREEASTSSKASVAKSPDKGKGKAVNGKSAKGTPKAAKHHAAEDGENKSKKRKSSETASRPAPAAAAPQEVDFPRGGATGLTPLEYREATREARAEASRDEALFQDESVQKSKAKRQKLNRDKANAKKKGITTTSGVEEKPKLDYQRVEHLSYKRLAPGSRLLCSIVAVHSLALVVSLPNQLLGHIPITHISSQLTSRLQEAAEASDEDSEEEEDEEEKGDAQKSSKGVPELHELYHAGQWVRAIVTAVHSAGNTKGMGRGREGGEYDKESRRVELSLAPNAVNEGIGLGDLSVGYTLSAAIASVEDHGYILDAGLEGLSSFLSFKETAKLPALHGASGGARLQVGQLVNVRITRLAENGRTFDCTVDPASVRDSVISTPPSINALLPGLLMNALVTAAIPSGLNVKLFGMFDGTIDRFHLPPLPKNQDIADVYKAGKKLKVRMLWDIPSAGANGIDGDVSDSARKFALSAAPHIVTMHAPSTSSGQPLPIAYPIGANVQATVLRADNDWGLLCSVEGSEVPAFVHISRVSDDHIEKLSGNSGPWKVGTSHPARVTGHAPTDRLLLLSLQPSVLEKKFMRVSELTVGEVLKGTIKEVRPDAIFVELNGSISGVVFSLHFSDVRLKHPEKKYKPGLVVKCRVLSLDPSRNRISLTLKKSLVSSELPIVSTPQDARVGVVTHAVVSKFLERGMLVDLFGGLRALVPSSEAAEGYVHDLRELFFEGKVVKVRLTNIEQSTGRLSASVRQALPSFQERLNVDAVELGETVSSKVAAVHQDVVVLSLQPSQVRALISLGSLAHHRQTTVDALRDSLEEGEKIQDLVVIDKNAEKGIVIMGSKAKKQTDRTDLKGTLKVGEICNATVVQRGKLECTVELPGFCRGHLHITDCGDDFSDPESTRLPETGTTLQCVVLALRERGRQANVSIRPSRLAAAQGQVAPSVMDAEVQTVSNLRKDAKLRGYVKRVADAGVFVDLGRNITARVQIRELFDNFVKEWKPRFVPGQVVEGKITEIDPHHNKVEMSLRTQPGANATTQKHKPVKVGLASFAKGQKVKGFVRRVETFGVFVQIEGTDVSGLCHKSQISDNDQGDVLKAFSAGDKVKAIVLNVDTEKGKISFGLKPSYFDEEDFESSADEAEQEDDDEEVESYEEMNAEALLAEGSDDSDDADMLDFACEGDALDDEEAESDDGASDFIEEDEEEPSPNAANTSNGKAAPKTDKSAPSAAAAAPALALAGGFSWSARPADEDDEQLSASDSDDDDGEDAEEQGEAATKRSKRKKGKGKALEEDLTADLATKAPESNADFERLLLGSPNSSFLWIQFMSFQLQLSEVEKAREVARRALKVISFREEQEKMNVWIALLNLENTYGNEETLDAVFKEAVQANESETIHLRMIAIFEKTGKLEKAVELFKKTVKKFSYSVEVWTLFAKFYLQHDKAEDARQLLPRTMQSLEKRDHTEMIASFARLEFKFGDAERGRTIFEGLVDRHPKRLDLWWQYIDQETRASNSSAVRSLYERVLALKQSSKKAKSVLKKWLEFEKAHGSPEGQQAVLARARAFVEEMQRKQAPEDGEGDEDVEME